MLTTMAARGGAAVFFFLPCVLFIAAGAGADTVVEANVQYNAVYSFGDSLTDTGNLCLSGGCPNTPYGETYFGHPVGRYSDGRLVVDFLADAFGLPMLPPSKAGGSAYNYSKGANMAFGGATAMDLSFYQSIGLGNFVPGSVRESLMTQIQYLLQQLRPYICSSDDDCRDHFSKSLFIVGEIGGADYFYSNGAGRSIDVLKTYTPRIVTAISNAVETLIGIGATELVVPGVTPFGCLPVYLTNYAGGEKDGLGCLTSYNNLSIYHNAQLMQEVWRLRIKYPSARIMYADFYAPIVDMIQEKSLSGSKNGLLACCGAGGQGNYNYNSKAPCGRPGSSSCPDPQNYISWEGVHYTEAAYHFIANGWLMGPYCTPPILA